MKPEEHYYSAGLVKRELREMALESFFVLKLAKFRESNERAPTADWILDFCSDLFWKYLSMLLLTDPLLS